MRLIRHPENRSALLPAIFCACAAGLYLVYLGWGERISFDALVHFRDRYVPTEAVVVTMNEEAYSDTNFNKGYRYPDFNRAKHAEFVNRLKADGARAVVFDLFFKNPQPEDKEFAAAITNFGKVVIVYELEKLPPGFLGFHTNDPSKALRNLSGCKIAMPLVGERDVIRQFPPETGYRSTVARAAAETVGVAVDPFPTSERWVSYYGDRGELPREDYPDAFAHSEGYYKDKVVFVGGKPEIKLVAEASDEFGTPFTRWSGNKMRGVEIHATILLNLIRNEWLTRLSGRDETIVILLVGLVFGWVFTLVRPVPGLILIPVGVAAVSIGAVALYWTQRIWLNWLVIGWFEIPMAWATSAVIYSRVLARQKLVLERDKATLQKALLISQSAHPSAATLVAVRPVRSAAEMLVNVQPTPIKEDPAEIAQYEVLKKIGEGAFGQVWLARDRVATFCAIKVIYRRNFSDSRPFEQEFEGVQNFAAISRRHAGWVPILHVGISESGGFFYYVMDVADDFKSGPNIDPGNYTPKTLGKLVVERQYLPVEECIRIGIDLADALAALHAHRLVHRDIKPSNIIFANHRPKLADIGLVAQIEKSQTALGTEGFMLVGELGTRAADIFALGRVLYMAATGNPPDAHPSFPDSMDERNDARDLARLMEIINKACARKHEERYENAGQLHDDLVKLHMVFMEAEAQV